MSLRQTFMAAASSIAILSPATALAQVAVAEPAASGQAAQSDQTDAHSSGDIVVTARLREESVQDVPVAVTAVSGDFIKEQQLVLVKDIAAFAPGLTINSDSAGRAFISIRGIGTTVIETVQPGVGLFIDGIYQPNTSYLNSPLVDVERVEVLRGPQGTLFGNNTLGGAINVITRQPNNTWRGRIDAAAMDGDHFRSISGSIAGPIVRDVLQMRLAAGYHKSNGFEYNTLAKDYQNPSETKSVNGTIRFLPASWATFTINSSWDQVTGGSVPYWPATGPTDYSLKGQTNVASRVTIDYYAANIKGEFGLDSLKTKVTAVAAFTQANQNQPRADGDFSAIDFVRATADRTLKTFSGELRFDTEWSDRVSTLVGGYYSHYTTRADGTSTVVPINFTAATHSTSRNDNFAIFGTAFVKLGETLDLAAGIRFDHQNLSASTAGLPAAYKADNWQPRVTLTKHWTPDFMTYASIARGVRGGGQNGPGAPNLIYKGDSVWTYEVGTKLQAFDRRLSANLALFYNDYHDYIGPNALAPSTIRDPVTGQPVGFVAVNLNTGKAQSYGAEAEITGQITDNWRVFANLTLLHARVTDASDFLATTGYAYAGDRIPFVPAISYAFGTNVRVPVATNQAVVFDATVVGKGSRYAASLDDGSVPFLEAYNLVNASLAYENNGFTIAAFATNLFNTKYIESYLDKSLLGRAGVPAFLVNNLVIQGNRRRVGVRASYKF